MKDINIKMVSTVEKTIYYPQGAFVMGIKGDNDTSRVIFEVPSVYKQVNGTAIVKPPIASGITTQTPIPLFEITGSDNSKGYYSLIVSGDLTQYAGEWEIVLVLSGIENEDTPICVSDKIIAIVKDSIVDPNNFEELPENSNIKILYNELKSFRDQIEQTLLTADIATVQEIQEQLDLILTNMDAIVSIDWESIEGLANVGESIEELKSYMLSLLERVGQDGLKTLFSEFDVVQSMLQSLMNTINQSLMPIVSTTQTNTINIETKVDKLQAIMGDENKASGTLMDYTFWGANCANAANINAEATKTNTETILTLIGNATDELAAI